MIAPDGQLATYFQEPEPDGRRRFPMPQEPTTETTPIQITTDEEAVRTVAEHLAACWDVPPRQIWHGICLDFGADVLTLEQVGDLICDWPDEDLHTPDGEQEMRETILRMLGDWRARVAAERPLVIRHDMTTRMLRRDE